jgi:hypothetical protein
MIPPERVFTIKHENRIGSTGKRVTVTRPWVSDHEFMYPCGGKLFVLDRATGKERPKCRLSRLIARTAADAFWLEVAPGGKWAFWGFGTYLPTFASALNGSWLASWPRPWTCNHHLCADGRHWIEFLSERAEEVRIDSTALTTAFVHDVERLDRSVEHRELPRGLAPLEILCALSPHMVVAREPDEAIHEEPGRPYLTEDGTVLIARRSRIFHRATQTISAWDLDRPEPLSLHKVELPANVLRAAVSPDGTRIAWLTQRSADDEPGSLGAIWVSAMDGSGLRRIISTSMNIERHTLQWLPGGRSISFVVEGALYSVAAD